MDPSNPRSYIPLNTIFSGHDHRGYQNLERPPGTYQDLPFSPPQTYYEPQRQDRRPLIDEGNQQAFGLWSPDPNDLGGYSYEDERRDSVPPGQSDRSIRSGSSPKLVKRKPVSQLSLQSLREFHKPIGDPNRPNVKHYNFRRTRDKLFITCSAQWLVSVLIAGGVVAALIGYQKRNEINNLNKHVFNTLITGLSIGLGVNLASSLRSYAELLRWRVLASSWWTLREVDLILGCESQFKILELLFVSRRRKFPFISITQLLCFTWILINLSAQILVAMIGLTYSLDTSDFDVRVPGNVTIADFSTIRDNFEDPGYWTSDMAQQFQAQAYGIEGQDYSFESASNPYDAYDGFGNFHTFFAPENFSYALYRFNDGNPIDTSASIKSNRTITSTTVCNAFEVIDATEPPSTYLPGFVVIYVDADGQNNSLYVREWANGAVTYMSDTNLYCGPRCNRVLAFQAAQLSEPGVQLNITRDVVYDCNNTISEISNVGPAMQAYDLPDKGARFFAGAIGWTGYLTPYGQNTYNNLEYRLYSSASWWSPNIQLTAAGKFSAAMYISQFSMAAISAMDNNGPYAIVQNGLQPLRTLKVTVEWGNVAILLSTIAGIQFITLMVVILVANKAVIKDNSFLAISKLLAPTVMKIGPHGSVLTGSQIATEIFGDSYQVFYGCRQDQSEYGEMVYKADIIEKGQGLEPRFRRPFNDGSYD